MLFRFSGAYYNTGGLRTARFFEKSGVFCPPGGLRGASPRGFGDPASTWKLSGLLVGSRHELGGPYLSIRVRTGVSTLGCLAQEWARAACSGAPRLQGGWSGDIRPLCSLDAGSPKGHLARQRGAICPHSLLFRWNPVEELRRRLRRRDWDRARDRVRTLLLALQLPAFFWIELGLLPLLAIALVPLTPVSHGDLSFPVCATRQAKRL